MFHSVANALFDILPVQMRIHHQHTRQSHSRQIKLIILILGYVIQDCVKSAHVGIHWLWKGWRTGLKRAFQIVLRKELGWNNPCNTLFQSLMSGNWRGSVCIYQWKLIICPPYYRKETWKYKNMNAYNQLCMFMFSHHENECRAQKFKIWWGLEQSSIYVTLHGQTETQFSLKKHIIHVLSAPICTKLQLSHIQTCRDVCWCGAYKCSSKFLWNN